MKLTLTLADLELLESALFFWTQKSRTRGVPSDDPSRALLERVRRIITFLKNETVVEHEVQVPPTRKL